MRTDVATPRSIETTQGEHIGGIDSVLGRMWSKRSTGLVASMVAGAAFGALSGWLIPRGPVTTPEAVVTAFVSVLIGLLAGLAFASRWAMVVTPLTFIAAFEIVRLGATGPTVDRISVATTYTLIAFISGRFVHGLLVVPPMVIGTEWGYRIAAWRGGPVRRSPGKVGLGLAIAFTVALIIGMVIFARPASTAPIVGADGAAVPGAIAELTTIDVNGHMQSLMIRGRSQDAPVLLYLAGGPGGTDLGAMRNDAALESEFIVVTWDERGAGRSYASLEPVDSLTVDSLVDDTLEVTDYLRDRFDVDKVYLVGNSWGTTLGVLAAQRSPERYAAFVGAGQMVSQRATDVMFWEDTMAWAESTGRQALADQLQRIGPPPYENIMNYEPAVLAHEHDWNPYPELDLSLEMPSILFVPEYSWIDRFNAFRGFLDSGSVLYPQVQDIDFRTDVPRLEIPVTIVAGEHEARGRQVLADEWFQMLDAPAKQMVVFPGTGHRPHFEDPARFADLMSSVLASVEGDMG